ncbi:DUF3857 domain-containing protein [Mucilaginibacter achroorhodeus]|uniref:DUF3857 domain-containing protein n=1 Tax=Mucilaginibacter achroorhodeus TaxID=2599294 RepID=A0A563U055_9SPHI|nr:DUF3857 domain-containing protein [Mucilaginibacter achroorhodeus]TWR25018.1 DUF3857 domain-containing protein [Mucilaginibacter achroorhodeus]
MKPLYFILLICFSTICKAQTTPFGEVDVADLQLTGCSFEKNADAEILFDVAKVTSNDWTGVTMVRHQRIKIFNERGLPAATIKLNYFTDIALGIVKDIEAATYNLVDGKVEKTVLDKKQIYQQKVSKGVRQYVVVFPRVKAGSVIEYKFKWLSSIEYNYPVWKFQNKLPTKYSEYDAAFKSLRALGLLKNINRPLSLDTVYSEKYPRHVWVMKDVPSYTLEPYMHSVEDNLQYIAFRRPNAFYTWNAVVRAMMNDEDFGKQLDEPLEGEAEIYKRANEFKTDIAKIEYIFNTVKNTIKWNKSTSWYTDEGIKKAWLKKTGNSAEVNLILYHLLKGGGLSPTLAIAGDREIAEIRLDDPGYDRLEKTLVQVPLDSTQFLTLDASQKYNRYNFTPIEFLEQNMLTINPKNGFNDIVKLRNQYQWLEVTFVDAAIKDDGKLTGTTQLSSSFYRKVNKMEQYDRGGEKEYLDDLKAGNTKLSITDYKRYGMDVDTLPLREEFKFDVEAAVTDGDYIYFNPNSFTGLALNPFLNEVRVSDIDFIYLNRYNISGHYKLPGGYKIDALPKQFTLAMADNSIIFKRLIGEINGDIAVHYLINFNKTKFSHDEYEALYSFYKKMFELLNEQIVLKKVTKT